MNTTTKLQFRTIGNQEWRDFPAFPTVDNFNNDFPAEFMRGYYSSNEIAWEDDMQKFIDNEVTLEEFKAYGHDIPTKWQAEDEMKRLRQIIINETFSDFFSDLIAGKIEFHRVPQNNYLKNIPMALKAKLEKIQNEVIQELTSIVEFPEGLLPHTVFVEEEGEDRTGAGVPVYNEYKLASINPDGSCILIDPRSNTEEDRYLSEINLDWLITVWAYCCDLTGSAPNGATRTNNPLEQPL